MKFSRAYHREDVLNDARGNLRKSLCALRRGDGRAAGSLISKP